MPEIQTKVSNAEIEKFLQGSDPQKYIVAIESEYNTPKVTLVINDPEKGKYLEEHKYKPFLWFKEEIGFKLYNGKRMERINAEAHYGVKITRLRTYDANGNVPKRMENGYKYLATCTKSYNDLINFFKYGGVEIFDKENLRNFVMFSPTEQFLIQTGKRLFVGMDDYDDLHRFQFDLETEGLFPSKHGIFQIGVRDNRDLEHVLESKGESLHEKRDSERETIEKFFKIIDIIKPDIITGYNSENFDWPFIFERAERLSIPVTELAITLNRLSKIKRKSSTLKLGGETEAYQQTHMYGYNILDISHAVRRAMAINSEIKSWGLKYITQYSGIAKPNRVYVPGDKINTTWADKVNDYAFNDKNGDWYKIDERHPLKAAYKSVKGDFIVQRYLCDDLWETEQIDNLFNQASFLIAKLLPTSFQRSSTMGTAGQWKLIMAAWSYEKGLAIPETQTKRDFVGGLSRLLEVGYARNVVKLDYAALYPKTQITHLIFPLLDISGVMESLLTYVVDTRDKFKFLTGKEKKLAEKLEAKLKAEIESMTPEAIESMKAEIAEHKRLSNLYDKKQLPLKILANSWFGSYGAPYIFNWGDTDSAEETTCRGRQYLRLMVRHFCGKYNFKALVGDSVTYDTPVYIRNKVNGNIDIQPISDLFNENSLFLDNEKLRDFEEKNYDVLTRNGWRGLKYVYRHGTNKNIHRITTKDRLINVTEDHSLFQNNIEVKPSDLKRGDLIDTYDIPSNICKKIILDEDEAFLYGFFLGDGSSTNLKRKVKYKSKKTGEVKIYLSKRNDWKISNTNIKFLEKLQSILKDKFNVIGLIKNNLESSGVYNLVVYNSKFNKFFYENFYTSYRDKKIPKTIINANLEIKKAFINGVFSSDGYGDTIDTCSDIGMKSQIAMAGISLLLKELNIDFKIKTRKDKENFISFNLKNGNRNNSSFTEKTKKNTNEVWKNEIISNKDKNNFVYDISTDDGTFICGINGIIAHNTDGFNFSFPDNIDSVKYTAKGSHWKTTEDAGIELTGLDAVLAEFNENYMEGRMGLDIDDICNATINFARKNYANDITSKGKRKIKLVGNSVKSKKMSVYIEEFLGKAITMLLDGDGHSFIKFYYEYVDKIYNYQIPLVKIATKGKVKLTIPEYKKKSLLKNIKGNPLPKQAHMELAKEANLDITLGDVIYYINTGTSKSQGDIKTEKDKKTGVSTVKINCKLIQPSVVEKDFELIKELEMLKKALVAIEEEGGDSHAEIEERIESITAGLFTDEYNVNRYLDAFNKKVKPLLVCFHPDIRSKILLDIVKLKDKATKTTTEKLKDRVTFTKQECELVHGMPFKEGDQDTYEDLMRMEDKEIRFWTSVGKIPNNLEDESKWPEIVTDYHERMRIAKVEGIQREKTALEDIIKHLEVKDLLSIINDSNLPIDIIRIGDIGSDDNGLIVISRKWDAPLCTWDELFKYEKEAIDRDNYYKLVSKENDDNRYEEWLNYIAERKLLTGDTISINVADVTLNKADADIEKIKENANQIVTVTEEPKKKKAQSEGDEDEDDGDVETEEDENGDSIRTDDKIQLDDEVDDTFGDIPDGYIINKE